LIVFKKRTVFLLLLAAGLSVLYHARSFDPETPRRLKLFSNVFSVIQRASVDELSDEKLLYGALDGMARSTDPYGAFLDAKAFQATQVSNNGRFAGVGLEVGQKGGILHVITPLDGSPASRAGILPGDEILSIDHVPAKELSVDEAVRRLRGPEGSEVHLLILRREGHKVLELDLTRQVLKIPSIRGEKIFPGGIGYIRIARFSKETPEELERILAGFEKEGLKGLVLDLRNNPGGLLGSAIALAGAFVPKGTVLAKIQRRHAEERPILASRAGYRTIRPLLVLINEGSASGSELVAAAFKDNKRAVLVGSKTYGKGSIQSLIPFPRKTALRLTTSRFLTPKGQPIESVGVSPDLAARLGSPGSDPGLRLAVDLARRFVERGEENTHAVS